MAIETIKWVNGSVKIVDQRKLPSKLKFLYCKDVKSIWRAIKTLSIRGAPAIGVAAAFGILLGLKGFKGQNKRFFKKRFDQICSYLGTSRPTAVNLFNTLTRMKEVVSAHPDSSVQKLKNLLKKEALAIFNEDRIACRAMGAFGSRLIKNNAGVLTVCNAGALATVDYGTALGVMYSAKARGKRFKVYNCETRPLLQGSRLTSWELSRQRIDATLICDNMAATLMKQGKIDCVITGADRIAANGDAANKIGTYSLAVLARHHSIPFYIVAPFSTFDMNISSGLSIPIEQRDPQEVLNIANKSIAPRGIKVYNPAFDVTDHKLITAIVTEYGIITPPFRKNIKRLFSRHAK